MRNFIFNVAPFILFATQPLTDQHRVDGKTSLARRERRALTKMVAALKKVA